MTWHVDPAQARGYADGTVTGARAASVEAHLLACGSCRSLVARAAPAARLAQVWDVVQERVDAPRPLWLEWLLTKLGVRPDEARLMAAAPTLRGSWVVAVGLVLGFAAVAAGSEEKTTLLFLVVAPLVPVLGVAGAYGPGVDPTYDLTRAAPYPAARLLLLRALLVLAASVPLTLAWALVVGDGWEAIAWLLPALALVGVTLVLSDRFGLTSSGAAVAAGYLVLVGVTRVRQGDLEQVFAADGQVLSLVVALGCAALLLSPTRRLTYRRLP
jgi:hypothetical protein